MCFPVNITKQLFYETHLMAASENDLLTRVLTVFAGTFRLKTSVSTFMILTRNLKRSQFWYWILNFKGYQNVVQKKSNMQANFGNFYVWNVLKPYYKVEKLILFKCKRWASRFLKVNKKSQLKKLKKWKRYLFVHLEKRNCRKLLEDFRFCTESHKAWYSLGF